MSNFTILCHILRPHAHFTNSVYNDFILGFGLGLHLEKLNAIELSHPPY